MSTFVKHEAPRPTGAKFAWFCGIVWAILIAVMWFSYRNYDGEGGGILNFIGRFHVLFVHFPIGFIVLALIAEVLSHFTAFSHLQRSIPFMLWIGFFSGIAATIMGYLLMSLEDYAGKAMDLHMYFGLAVVVFTLLAIVFLIKGKKALYSLSLVLAAFVTFASGHFGGAMVHDDDYLTEFAPEPVKPLLTVGLGHPEKDPIEVDVLETEEPTETPLAEHIVYADFVHPILEAKCNECHNENKIKGKLRMDTYELLIAGAEGTDYPTIIPDNADESEFIVRVTLPHDDDDFMPPKGDPLTPEEIELISLWINAGASLTTTVAELGDDPKIEATALAVAAQMKSTTDEEVADTAIATFESVWETLTPEEQEERMKEVLAAADRLHFSVMPISAEDDRLRVNVINANKEFGDEQLALLEPVADRVVWLDLARSQVTDAGMDTVGKMRALERLHLENTKVSDEGIAKLAALKDLEYINLYGTQVGNAIFDTFRELPRLKKVYVWQTQVDPSEARAYERSVNLEINTGVELAAAAAPAPAEEKQEAKPEEKAPEKKPAPKPEAKPAAKTEPAKPAPKPEVKPASKPESPEAKETPAKPKAKPEPKKADAPPAKPKEVKPADQPKAAEPKPAPKTNPKPAEKPAPKTDSPPAAKPTEEKKKA